MERSDIELMLRAQDDDLAAFAQLTQRYRDPCAGSLPALLMDSSEADDCAQETLLRLWLLRREYKPTGKFSTYLFQIGKHHLLNQSANFARRPVMLPWRKRKISLLRNRNSRNGSPCDRTGMRVFARR